MVIIIGVTLLMVSIGSDVGLLVKLGIVFNIIGLILLIGSLKSHIKYKDVKRLELYNRETPFYIRMGF